MSLKIYLSGPQGNAFYLMALVENFGRQLGIIKEERDTIITEMESSDYDNLVKIFAKNFGMYVEIYDKDGELYDWKTAYIDGA